jgi:hypothetical protein
MEMIRHQTVCNNVAMYKQMFPDLSQKINVILIADEYPSATNAAVINVVKVIVLKNHSFNFWFAMLWLPAMVSLFLFLPIASLGAILSGSNCDAMASSHGIAMLFLVLPIASLGAILSGSNCDAMASSYGIANSSFVSTDSIAWSDTIGIKLRCYGFQRWYRYSSFVS